MNEEFGRIGGVLSSYEIWGLGAHAMFPVGNNFYVSPNMTYYFPKTYLELLEAKVEGSGLGFNVDAHYALHLGNEKSFISPLVGLGGFVAWAKASGDGYNVTESQFTVVANVGLSGRFNLGHNLFTNPQVKYMIPFKSGMDGEFVISCGLGMYF